MDKNVIGSMRQASLHPYGRASNPLSNRKEEISPWSFYQENTGIRNILDNISTQLKQSQRKKPKRKINSNRNSISKQIQTNNNHKRLPSPQPNKSINPESPESQQNLKALEEINTVSKQIKGLLRERIILRAVAKYLKISESSLILQPSPSLELPPSPTRKFKKSVVEININSGLVQQKSNEFHRRIQQKAFNDIQMQIHSMPSDLRMKSPRSKKPPSALIIQKQENCEDYYAEERLRRSIEVSGEKKKFSLKDG